MNTLESVIEYGYIVAASDEIGVAVTWNGSATFNWWIHDYKKNEWANTDVMTVYGVERVESAAKIAENWIAEEISGEPDED